MALGLDPLGGLAEVGGWLRGLTVFFVESKLHQQLKFYWITSFNRDEEVKDIISRRNRFRSVARVDMNSIACERGPFLLVCGVGMISIAISLRFI